MRYSIRLRYQIRWQAASFLQPSPPHPNRRDMKRPWEIPLAYETKLVIMTVKEVK